MTKEGQTYYYHFDRLGTITAITDSSGNLLEEYYYDPFGKPLNKSDIGNRYMFTGREWDSEIGLYYYRARYYDPEAGRFISADPFTWAPNDPRSRGFVWLNSWFMLYASSGASGIDCLTKDIALSNLIRERINNRSAFNPSLLNLYTYCNNNPVNRLDPWGLWDWGQTWSEWESGGGESGEGGGWTDGETAEGNQEKRDRYNEREIDIWDKFTHPVPPKTGGKK